MMEESLLSPSALSTKTRCTLKKSDPVAYSHLYHRNHQDSNVWSRLTKDASRRTEMRPKNGTYVPTPVSSPCDDSGFASNNKKTRGPLPPEDGNQPEPDMRSLHFKTLRSFKKKYPIEFMASVRPNTVTINNTLAMWGCQASDRSNGDILQRSQRVV
eukprot:CAMPEP_0177756334 /NCGR_PEP_ID=MMETSP0491_2-20121128/3046_1 /TAXON_ID=63592 /ORGANISM="Tetraselmis chuii, Strain PLY429" /LENGTH=156 /DNA_ID=CAMNT_0019271895 /DNA_START=205 /DNA_END=675 /DNA_ORIENTATION=-